MGLGGGISRDLPIPADRIRAEGGRLGYRDDGLEDFEAIVVRVDDIFVEVTVRKQAADAKAAALKAQQQRGRR